MATKTDQSFPTVRHGTGKPTFLVPDTPSEYGRFAAPRRNRSGEPARTRTAPKPAVESHGRSKRLAAEDPEPVRIAQANSLRIIVLLLLALSFHFCLGYGKYGFMVFPKEHLSLSYTVILPSTIEKFVEKHNSAEPLDRLAIRKEYLYQKLMEKGIITEMNSVDGR